MSKLLCGKCGGECDAADIYICADCGGFVCGGCKTATDGFCPACYGPLNKLC